MTETADNDLAKVIDTARVVVAIWFDETSPLANEQGFCMLVVKGEDILKEPPKRKNKEDWMGFVALHCHGEEEAEVLQAEYGGGPEEQELRQQWLAKHEEIAAHVAKAFSLGPLSALKAEQRQDIDDEVDEMIESHDEAVHEGDTTEEWRALDQRLAATPVGRLLQELHEISARLQDLRDQRLVDPDEDDGED
jgi:hypothetical protein